MRALVDEAGVEEIAAHHAEQAVTEFLVVHEQLLGRVVEQLPDRAVDRFEPGHELVVRAERHVHRRQAGLFIRVQVVRRVEQRHDVREAVHGKPDQLFLASYLAVVAREATGPLTRAEPVHDHPREITGLQSLRPASAQSCCAHAAIP